MRLAPSSCREIEPDLIAVATGEGTPSAARAVEEHVASCPPCLSELSRYRAVDELVADLRSVPMAGADATLARAELESRLADLRSRLVAFGVFASPLGPILIARSEHGVSLVEYLETETSASARLERLAGDNAVEDVPTTAGLFRDLLEYLEGRRTRLDWPLDLSGARSDFQRRVLEITARLPYGSVTSYGSIAREMGAPTASRAVAQALRWNPVPIVVPCHRVIGSSGDLTGYAGDKVGLKDRLLSLEGVRTQHGEGAVRVNRHAMYLLHVGETEYCLPTCGSLATTPMAELTLFGSRERAEAAGFAPCTGCRPDLHPLPA
jgi:methylated-DNA-[protein]-cysteine S-methyltransferase